MTDIQYRRPSETIAEREVVTANQSGGGGGSGGGGSGGGSSGGGGGSGNAGNEARENQRYTGRGDSRGNNADEQRHQESQGQQPQQQRSSERSQSQPQSYQEKENSMSHTYCPPTVVAGGYPGLAPFSPYGYGLPYGGFPAAGAPSNVVVTGGHGSDKHDALLGITVDNIRESSAVGRTNQLATQVSHIGDHIDTLADRADARASADRDLFLHKSFSDLSRGQAESETRIMAAFKDSEIRRLQDDTVTLKEQVADSREARRFDDLRDSIRDLSRLLADRLPRN